MLLELKNLPISNLLKSLYLSLQMKYLIGEKQHLNVSNQFLTFVSWCLNGRCRVGQKDPQNIQSNDSHGKIKVFGTSLFLIF